MVAAIAPEGFVSQRSLHVLSHVPLHDLVAADGGEWLATGDDPQFLLHCRQPLPEPGVYHIKVRVEGEQVSRPCLYLDYGQGWSEATRVDLQPAGAGRWFALVELPRLAANHRFDPSDKRCRFAFDGLSMERLDDAEALLVALRRKARQAPDRAGALIEAVAQDALDGGVVPACGRLLRDEAMPQRPGDAYAEWIARHDSLSSADRAALDQLRDKLPSRPLLSLLLPMEGLTPGCTEACIDSLLVQAYPDWELIVACTSTLRDAARHLCDRSSRVRVVEIVGDGRPDALEPLLNAAGGTLSAWLAGAPVLAPHALLAFVQTHLAHPEARILYADSDRLQADGHRVEPWFRPAWNPDLFLAKDFLAGVAMVNTELLRTAVAAAEDEGDRLRLAEGLLRCVAECTEAPRHLPLVLWHQPMAATPMATTQERLPALARHLRDTATGATCEATASGARIRWPLPDPPPKASLIVPTRDRVGLLKTCVGSVLARTTYPSYEVVVVDNGSVERETLDYLASLQSNPRVRIVRDEAAFNYAAINNRAVRAVDGDVVVLLNNDVEVITPGWLEEMVSHALRRGIGAVGAMLYYPDDTIQHAGVVLGLGGVAGHVYSREPRGTPGVHGRAALAQDMSAVTAACLAVRRDVFLDVGGFDEELRVAFNDIDFCLRLSAAGYRNVWTPFAELYHHESASRGAEDTPEKRARFVSEVNHMLAAWPGQIADDPAYSPNLSLHHGAANTLADPPRNGLRHWLDHAAVALRNSEGT